MGHACWDGRDRDFYRVHALCSLLVRPRCRRKTSVMFTVRDESLLVSRFSTNLCPHADRLGKSDGWRARSAYKVCSIDEYHASESAEFI